MPDEKSPPLFSIVIPTFNRGRFVTDALDSLFGQSHRDFEVLVVDDGSTDDTEQRLDPYMDRIRFLKQANAGPAAAKNLGIREARGTYVGFLDSDDAWEPQTLAEVLRVFGQNPRFGLVSIMAREVRADGTRTKRVYGKRSPGTFYTTKTLLWGDSGGCSWFFVRRDLLLEVEGFDESLRSAEECDLAIRLSFEAPLFALRRPMLLRRKHDDNLSEDMRLNARCWILLLEKLAHDQPAFVRRNALTYRRALAKERLRLGRELLAHEGEDAVACGEARTQLRRSVTTFPFFLRAYIYLAWSLFAPQRFAAWREREVRMRARR